MLENQTLEGHAARLRELSDPEFMTHWAALRRSLCFLSKQAPRYPEIKQRYEEAAVEYRRRMHG